jgi:hypothetical protein
MKGEYLGLLPTTDPLYAFLAEEVLDQVLGFSRREPTFDVYRLDGSSTVFRYKERETHIDLVGKFYGNKWMRGSQTGERELRAHRMRCEFNNLHQVRLLGLDTTPCRVVRPLAISESINCILVEEFAFGYNLDFLIREAVYCGKADELHECLTDIAWFLANLHNRSCSYKPINQEPPLNYMNKVMDQLSYWHIISAEQKKRLEQARDRWAVSQMLRNGFEVTIHGDANPTNFLYKNRQDMVVIDLERLTRGDRAADLGCIAAELKHLFWYYGKGPLGGEEYIKHFYARYGDHLSNIEDFGSLTNRCRFYMTCIELRISRNSWLDLQYRRQLIEDAIECLKI